MLDYGLIGKVAMVTGGSHGIGLATALALGKSGCKVALCGRTEEHVIQASKVMQEAGIESLCSKVDLTDHFRGLHWLEEVRHTLGSVDILINNVGGGGGESWGTNFNATAITRMKQVMEKNLWVAVLLTQSALISMKGWGRVVTVSSIYGKETGGMPWFNAAKAAEIAFMKNLAHYGTYPGVTFNTVAPGHIAIPGKSFGKDLPVTQWIGQPEDVAQAVLFLCSEQAKFINGTCLVVDGGQSKSY